MRRSKKPKRKDAADSLTSNGRVFPVGAEVEVRIDDDGFRGAWYEATVADRCVRRQRRRYDVIYSSLVADAEPSLPLREIVAESHVRPRPPRRLPDSAECFELHQPVEAFHNDGWWAGVVSGLLKPATGRYTVCFPNTREVVEFEPEEIRERLQWARGKWIPARDKGSEVPLFSAGAKVEVIRDLENYGSAWFPATIMKVIRFTDFLVEYDNLIAEDNRELLTEILDAHYIRPATYISQEAKKFGSSSEVEVFCNCAWSPGVVLKVLGNSKYAVKVKSQETEVEMEVDNTLLRSRREWDGRQWICNLSKGKNGKSTLGGDRPGNQRQQSAVGRSFPISLSGSTDEDAGDTHEPMSCITKMKRKMAEGSSNGGYVDSIYHEKRLQKERPIEFEFRSRFCSSSKGNAEMPLRLETNAPFAVPTLEYRPFECHLSSMVLEKHIEIPSSERTPATSHVSTESPRSPLSGEQTHGRKLSRVSGITEPLVKKGSYSDLRCEGSEDQSKASDVNTATDNREPDDLLPLAELKGCRSVSGSKISVVKRKKLFIRAAQTPKESPDIMKAGAISRGLKESVNRLLSWKESGESKQFEETPDHVVERQHSIAGFGVLNKDPQEININSINGTNKKADAPLEGHTAFNLESLTEVDAPTKCPTMLQSCTLQKSSNAGTEKMLALDSQAQNAVSEAEEEGLLSPSGNSILKECDSNVMPTLRFRNSNERALVNLSPCGSLPNKTFLPFAKSSFIWESIESMEIFRRVPQEPHFLPLEQYCSQFREGMAIGLMVSFANLVASIDKLNIDDDLHLFEEKLNGLVPLEANGFNVQCVRSRLNELLQIKNLQAERKRKKAALEEKILERQGDNDRLNALIHTLDVAIPELEQNLALFRERRNLVMAQRNGNSSDISRLKMDVAEVEKSYFSAEQLFHSALSESW
ncbi:DUF724 domain-containing protein 6-like [Typha latifolia]|uniref:DUF724 domain-containing protein 6-like n=1 Tax=Typha latifolia TaxID=4733 RepID=UPI003C2D28CB